MIDILETKPPEALRDKPDSTAVKRGIDNLQILVAGTGFRAQHQGEDVGHVVLIHLTAHQFNLSAALALCESDE